MYASPSTQGFYSDLGGRPDDAVQIDDNVHAAIMAELSTGEGKVLDWSTMPPQVVDAPQPPPAEVTDMEIKAQIQALEATVTQRRLREAILGTDGGWLAAIDQQIAALRAQLS